MDEIKERLGKEQAEMAELLLKTAKETAGSSFRYEGDGQKVRLMCAISDTISNACRAFTELQRQHLISFSEVEPLREVTEETTEEITVEVTADDAPENAKPDKPAEEPTGATEAQTPAE